MTTNKVDLLQRELDKANPNTLADALRLVKLGHLLAPIKVTFAALSAAAAVDITTAASKAAATIVGITLESTENLPPIGVVRTLRVTAGAAQAGPRVVTDAGGTAAAGATGLGGAGGGVALISDDGKTLTFEGNVTGFVLEYYPLPFTSLQSTFTDQG